ncbi:hypothetical protein pdam_00014203 [Pocillopora damicornis]|uniref:Piwi-like protein 1 n=1 Tax=Pocillopora damicornis TaxID=46731 RepID=A0A3M6V534_POCDA|nr:hypothetical protein pdam_00014203 [Pocillopora damicornis]
MTGRARGRSRGRGRGGGEASRPGDGAQQVAPVVGRGRSRGPPPGQVPQQQRPVAPPIEAMAGMSMKEQRPHVQSTSGAQEQRPPCLSRDVDDNVNTKPAHLIDKKGNTGTRIDLVTNHFKLRTTTNFGVYQYNVSFNPEVEAKRARIAILSSQRDLIGPVRAFDGMILYLPRRLSEIETRCNVTRPQGDVVQMTITFTNEVEPGSPSMLQLYNIIFRRILKDIGMQQVGRNYYNISKPIEIPKFGLQLWPGYSTSILPYETDILLSADVSHKVLRTTTVLEYLYELYECMGQRGNFHMEATKKLVGQIVLTRYNNKTYRIDDINWEIFPTNTFHGRFKGVERDITYVEYYQETYDKEITDMEQPLLVSRLKREPGQKTRIPSGELLLVPELCFLTGLTDEMRNDFSMMKDLAVHTRVDPMARNKSLMTFIDTISSNSDASAELSGWNLEFEKRTLQMSGRVLPPEKIFQKSKSFSYDPKTADWSREMRGNPLQSTVNLDSWLLIYSSRDSGNAKDFAQTLSKVCGPMGIKVSKSVECQLNNDRTESYLDAIKGNFSDSLQMVVTILTTNRKDRYDAIKKLCCLETPVPSQVIVGRTISKKNMLMSVCTKIGIQLNCKLGGEAWAVEIPVLFKAALKKYRDLNGGLPDRIIVYRDGVGDGQLKTVVNHEVPQLKASFKDLPIDYSPKFAVVIVKKRISARIFHQTSVDALSNPPPGTVVDSVITKKQWYDFFCVSQSVRQGTVSPTHYNVIEDSTGLLPDHFQRLTYKLTHLYYNWPGTVRVPAPCQYAHKLAFLVGQSLHKPPHIELAEKLFFL